MRDPLEELLISPEEAARLEAQPRKMRPFNLDLYARSAEGALRRIAVARALDADDLREIAYDELATLKVRYRHNGYIGMQPDQREAQAQATSPSTENL